MTLGEKEVISMINCISSVLWDEVMSQSNLVKQIAPHYICWY